MTLYELIHSLPEAEEYGKVGNDSACAEVLNRLTERGLVLISEIVRWSFLNGVAPLINIHALNPLSPLYIPCYIANAYLNNPRFESIDLDLPQVRTMLDGLMSGKIINEEQYQELLLFAENKRSIAEKELGTSVSVNEVSESLLIDRKEGRV